MRIDPPIRVYEEVEDCADVVRGRFRDDVTTCETISGSLPGQLMKPAPFEYVRPTSLAEACELLAGDEDARLIAGGQTLVPMLAMRLARPARLIDILRLPELAGIHEEPSLASISPGSRSAGWTAVSASILRSWEGSSAVAAQQRTTPLKSSPLGSPLRSS